jgi:hypothetical protein
MVILAPDQEKMVTIYRHRENAWRRYEGTVTRDVTPEARFLSLAKDSREWKFVGGSTSCMIGKRDDDCNCILTKEAAEFGTR